MSKKGIIFYDIPFAKGNICWSSNTWKARYCLNYKRLTYRTEWVEYPDIKPLCIKIGAAPTSFDDKGDAEYTLPVIYDENTGQVVSESFNIAVYLDTTYPDTPRVFPPGTKALQAAFVHYAGLQIGRVIGDFLRPVVYEKLPPGKSQEYFRRTREEFYKVKIEDLAPRGEARVREWKKFENALVLFSKHFGRTTDEAGGEFICGKEPSFADFVMAGLLQWCKEGFGSDSTEWKDIVTWQDGRWGKYIDSLENYSVVV
ncbi:hypothetical protein F5878DRAFT_421783 [Lentinula raphanica]|uniref:GST N-terminal domain-containing protein n=1 Tax=Lentinula raphanica TaxID=153919 RepID=A0AA38U6M7_9AGAR|nr:hypothetical protein F5878DRAFT_421783 [Lentinula raphanica]